MSLTEEERRAVVNLKIAKSDKAFDDMLRNFELGMYSTAANRLYYALFYASSALLVNDGLEVNTHSGNLTLLSLHYIKTKKIPEVYGKLLRNVFRLRQESDYDDYFSVTRENLIEFINPSKQFIELVKGLIQK